MGKFLQKGGLQPGKNAEMLLGGKKFLSWGTNCYSLLNHKQRTAYEMTETYKALDVFKEYNVRAVRFNCGCFYAEDWGYYFDDEKRFFDCLDKLGNTATKKIFRRIYLSGRAIKCRKTPSAKAAPERRICSLPRS